MIGGELIAPFMDWSNRNVAVLFGDGCAAVVLQATDREEGVLDERLGCDVDGARCPGHRGHGRRAMRTRPPVGKTEWIFEGQEIFKRAVIGMSEASATLLAAHGS